MSDSLSKQIIDAWIGRLETLKTPTDKVRTVSSKFRNIEDVNKSEMPYIQAIPSTRRRENVPSAKRSNVFFLIENWIYTWSNDDIEDYIEKVRILVYADRALGLSAQVVMNTEVTKIERDDIGFTTHGLAIVSIEIKFREQD